MSNNRDHSTISLRAWGAALAVMASSIAFTANAQEGLRPDVGRPLQAAQEMIKAQRYKEALNKVRDAEAVGGRTANENFLIERMRIAAASGAGDTETAARSYEILSGTGRLSAPDKTRMLESITGGFYRSREYAKAMQWGQRYFREGGSSPSIRTILIQSQYLGGDFAGAAKELMVEVQNAERSGTPPPEDRLKLLLNAASKQNDNNNYVYAMERLVTYYPKKEYWVDLLSRMQRKAGFSDRLSLDTYRLSLATGSMTAANDYMEMAQLALQADLPSESKRVVDKGFATGALGAGAEAERQKRLRDLVMKRLDEDKRARADDERQALAAKTGDGLVSAGFNLVFDGEGPKGVGLIQQGIAKGGLKRPEDAKLHLGIAQLMAGEKAKAVATFRTVAGTDGTADLARLWSLYAKRG